MGLALSYGLGTLLLTQTPAVYQAVRGLGQGLTGAVQAEMVVMVRFPSYLTFITLTLVRLCGATV